MQQFDEKDVERDGERDERDLLIKSVNFKMFF